MAKYTIAVPGEKYKNKEGKEKTPWTQVGVAFLNDNGSITCKINDNISVSRELVLFEVKENEVKEKDSK